MSSLSVFLCDNKVARSYIYFYIHNVYYSFIDYTIYVYMYIYMT